LMSWASTFSGRPAPSLACKMQASADSNGIVVGDNIKTNTDLQFQELMYPVSKRTGDESDRYIFRIGDESFLYTQYDLDWLKFLKMQPYILTDLTGEIKLRRKNVIQSVRNIENLRPIAAQNKPYMNEKYK
ncbi:MAG: hypothetical protein ACQEQ0_10935, partial [Bacteroidota bacterium]